MSYENLNQSNYNTFRSGSMNPENVVAGPSRQYSIHKYEYTSDRPSRQDYSTHKHEYTSAGPSRQDCSTHKYDYTSAGPSRQDYSTHKYDYTSAGPSRQDYSTHKYEYTSASPSRHDYRRHQYSRSSRSSSKDYSSITTAGSVDSSSILTLASDTLSCEQSLHILHNQSKKNSLTVLTPIEEPKTTNPKKNNNFITNKVTNFFSYITSSKFWAQSKPVLLPIHRSPSQIQARLKKLEEYDRIEKKKTKITSTATNAASTAEQENIYRKFRDMVDSAQKVLKNVRELPQYGQWYTCFSQALDDHTTLWDFQKYYSSVLINNGLKEWQIGEIASHIGQLYYHFYLRTSQIEYLQQALSFYCEIRDNHYYANMDDYRLMKKLLRYYARFILVCLLLKHIKLVEELTEELNYHVTEYIKNYIPSNKIEWSIFVNKVKVFIRKEQVLWILKPENHNITISQRLNLVNIPAIQHHKKISLQEVLIVGNIYEQINTLKLTIDMYRMLQTLETDATGAMPDSHDWPRLRAYTVIPSAVNSTGYRTVMVPRRSKHPHKHLLFRPSPSQILMNLALASNDLPSKGALLLYISTDKQNIRPQRLKEYNDRGSYGEKSRQPRYEEVQCLHPEDIYPITKKPLFIIIDSDNSYAFQSMPRHFKQQLVILMSPVEPPSLPHLFESNRVNGSLFTLFLHSPIDALCKLNYIDTISLHASQEAQALIDKFLDEALKIWTRSNIDSMFRSFLGDGFLGSLILRFILCEVVLRMYHPDGPSKHMTRSSPPIPEELIEHDVLRKIVSEIISILVPDTRPDVSNAT